MISKRQFNSIETLTTLFHCFTLGKKIIDFKMRHDAKQGKKIKGDSIIYTPEKELEKRVGALWQRINYLYPLKIKHP